MSSVFIYVLFFLLCLFRPVDMCIAQLASSFHVDCLLPRTLLSVMSLEHIEKIFESKVVPPDACIANVFYFVLSERSFKEEVCYWFASFAETQC